MRSGRNDERVPRAREIAALLRYPSDDFRVRLQCATDVLEGEARQSVVAFSEETACVSPEGLEELYTRTFDLNPVATLEVGWHVWGEQYERGRFLADLRPLEAAHGIDSEPELPDHLTALLPLVAALGPVESATLVQHVETAIAKILVPLDEHGNPYRHLIRAAKAVLDQREPVRGPSPLPPLPDFAGRGERAEGSIAAATEGDRA